MTDHAVRCAECRWVLDGDSTSGGHAPGCSRGPAALATVSLRDQLRRSVARLYPSPSDEPPPDIVVSLASRRQPAEPPPADSKVLAALREALRLVESGEMTPQHAMVVLGGSEKPGCSYTRVLQGGDYNHHGQMGLLASAAHVSWEGA